MTQSLETQQPYRAVPLQQSRGGAVCALLEPAGMTCSKPAGHQPPCSPGSIEPPASALPSGESEPAAFAVSEPQPAAPGPRQRKRKYGFKRAVEFDLEVPSGSWVLMRKLTNTQAIDLGLVNMRDAFAPDLLKDLREALDDGDEDAEQQAVEILISDETREKIWVPINKTLALATVDPKVVLDEADADDDHVHVSEIDMRDKLVMFDAALPDELKAAAQEGQLAALKSLRT